MQSVAEVQATPSFHPWTTGGGLHLAMFGVSYVFAIQGQLLGRIGLGFKALYPTDPGP